MKVSFAPSFFKSFSNYVNTQNPFSFYFYRDKWWDLKMSVWALVKYFRITTKMVPWDYSSVLQMMNFQISILCDHIEKKGHEVDESRLPKVEKMRRFIELSNNFKKDDFADRCGYDSNWNFRFEKVEGQDYSHMVTTETEEQKVINSKAIADSIKLEEDEWNEMMEILKDMRAWWD